MEELIERGCGIDVHKKVVVATIKGKGLPQETKSYSTMTKDLLQLKKWLLENEVTHVAMESTGIYWRPLFNILEDHFVVLLVNARHIKYVPGRKTDVIDSEWICYLLLHGLLKPSFIPPRDIRQLRDLTRYRKKLIGYIAAEKNRIQKVLEDANIKLSSVVSDTFGVSGSLMLEELMKGIKSLDEIVDLAKGRLTKKKKELRDALDGYLLDHHIFMLQTHLNHIKKLKQIISQLERKIKHLLKPYKEEFSLLCGIPAVSDLSAASIIAEIGVDMSHFPSEHHLASWAGMCPGNNESAGKRKSGKTTNGNNALKVSLTECAWAASKTKGTYLQAKYKSLVGRRGKKRALIAVGHKILIICYILLRYKVNYHDIGVDWLDKRREKQIIKGCLKKLEQFGYSVELKGAA